MLRHITKQLLYICLGIILAHAEKGWQSAALAGSITVFIGLSAIIKHKQDARIEHERNVLRELLGAMVVDKYIPSREPMRSYVYSAMRKTLDTLQEQLQGKEDPNE